MSPSFLPHDRLQRLIDELAGRGYEVIGPQVREGAVVLAPLGQATALPWGARDTQAPGRHALEIGEDSRAFGWVIGPTSLKPFIFKQQETLWQSTADASGQRRFAQVIEARPRAIIGVRPCDVRAMVIHDRIFLGGDHADPHYQARREGVFIVVVQCTLAADTCFCISQGGEPRADRGYDLALTEVEGGLVVDSGSPAGEAVLSALTLAPAGEEQTQAAAGGICRAAAAQRRRVPPGDRLRKLLPGSKDHPQWDAAGAACEGCGNCTKLCPTCICARQVYLPSLDGEGGEQVREWASCHNDAHSVVGGVSRRVNRRERYRMRVTHKFANYQEQFGAEGCVGCGRCLSFCTKGIDVTAVLNAIDGGSPHE